MANSLLLLLAALPTSASGFAFLPSPPAHQLLSSRHQRKAIQSSLTKTHRTTLQMSDFPSAMPEKPVQSMEDQLRDSATSFIADITARLGEGVSPPPELEELKKIRDDEGSDVKALSLKIYELMIGE